MKETKQAVYLPIPQLHPFEGHPFKVQDNEEMEALVESIQSGGILAPLIVRQAPLQTCPHQHPR